MKRKNKIKSNVNNLNSRLVSISRIAIWNVTAKQVILITSDPQMSGDGDPWS